MKIAICFDGAEIEYQSIINACNDLNLEYKKIDLYSHKWMEELKDNFDFVLIRPPCTYSERKSLFDERMFFIKDILKLNVYPEFKGLMCYENKRLMQAFLQHSGLKYPNTFISYNKTEAINFINRTAFPVVFKTNTGSGASGVEIIKNKQKANKLINKCFGIRPDIAFGKTFWGNKNGIPYPRLGVNQKHYVIFQECLDIKWEWRIIKIGDSYFGHKKLLNEKGFASGSLLKGWELPPTKLLDEVRFFCDKYELTTISIDFFEDQKNVFYANEIQAIFGHSSKDLMLNENKPCRYKYIDSNYLLEYGDFCENQSWNNRLEVAIKKYRS